MIYEFEPLTQEEKDVLLKVPALVAVLIASADNSADEKELKRAVELVNIKTFSEKQDLHVYYHQVEETIQSDIADIIAALPEDAGVRLDVISDELKKVNTLLPRIKQKFAHDLYLSWKDLALQIAQASGGILGLNTISPQERELIVLPMINEPDSAK